MSEAGFLSAARFVAWRNLRLLLRRPSLLLLPLLLPLLFLVAFAGALSRMATVPDSGIEDYTGFQYVFALMQSAAFTGAMGGFAIAGDFESGFMRRLLAAIPHRSAIVAGTTAAMLARAILAAAALTAVALAIGMDVGGSALELLGLALLVVLLVVAASLWAAGIAVRIRSMSAAPAMALPIFVLLFLAPVFMPLDLLSGWLHAVAVANPLTRLLEAGRSLLAGEPSEVGLAFGIAIGLALLAAVWAARGVRRAEQAGV